MIRITITLFTIFSLTEAYCQPIWTDAGNKRIIEWDSSYTVETKNFFNIYYQYIIKRDKKIISEYFRHDDTCYLFVGYDSIGRQNQRGLIKRVEEPFECYTLAIPNWKEDSTGSKGITKDTIVCDESYRKEGYWKETDSTGMIWRGSYKNGLKDGEWEEGVYFILHHSPASVSETLYDNFRPYIKHIFKNGVEIPLFKDSVLKLKIIGSWVQYKLSTNTIIWEREKRQPQYHFKNNELVILYRRPQYPKNHYDKKRLLQNGNKMRIRLEYLKMEDKPFCGS